MKNISRKELPWEVKNLSTELSYIFLLDGAPTCVLKIFPLSPLTSYLTCVRNFRLKRFLKLFQFTGWLVRLLMWVTDQHWGSQQGEVLRPKRQTCSSNTNTKIQIHKYTCKESSERSPTTSKTSLDNAA